MRPRRYAQVPHRTRHHQRGLILLVTVLLVGVVLSVSLFGLLRANNAVIEDMAQTERALAQAKEALIAYASGRMANRPGELPCPDRTNNGQATTPCNTVATQMGRLPWFTLGIPDLRDGSGERLWYAVSNNFKNNNAVTPLNSNTPGQLTVTGVTPASNVIAIVFAPGGVVAGQSRTTANANNVTHYLEGENANGDTVFGSAPASGTFNDRLLAITPVMFFPAVENRVARDIRQSLLDYYLVRGYFPPANLYSAGGCITSQQGFLPADPSSCSGGYASYTGTPMPTWFNANQWFRAMFYAVAPACANPAAPNCTGAGGLLTVNSTPGVRAVLIAPGVPYAGQTRPCTSHADCLEPPNATGFPVFTHAPGAAAINDRVVTVAP